MFLQWSAWSQRWENAIKSIYRLTRSCSREEVGEEQEDEEQEDEEQEEDEGNWMKCQTLANKTTESSIEWKQWQPADRSYSADDTPSSSSSSSSAFSGSSSSIISVQWWYACICIVNLVLFQILDDAGERSVAPLDDGHVVHRSDESRLGIVSFPGCDFQSINSYKCTNKQSKHNKKKQ